MGIDIDLLFSLAVFALVTSITPGPNNLMVMASGAAFGVRRTVPHVAGIAIGFATMIGGAVFGLGALLEAFPWALDVVRYVGAAWMFWLAWQFLSPLFSPPPASEEEGTVDAKARPFRLYEAALFQWINPKAWAMAVATAGAYAGITDDTIPRTLAMCAVFTLVGPASNFVWVIGGQTIRRLLSPANGGRMFSGLMGVLVAVSAGLILFA
ncbi:LysE family translocator [Hwanghaeella grinnelliae]|nr:LysE family translocator [Hwanghaeella grinnelliae]